MYAKVSESTCILPEVGFFEEFLFAEISIGASPATSPATLRLLNSECDQVRFAGLSPTCRSTALFAADSIVKKGYEVCGAHNFYVYMLLYVMGHPCPLHHQQTFYTCFKFSNSTCNKTAMIENEYKIPLRSKLKAQCGVVFLPATCLFYPPDQ